MKSILLVVGMPGAGKDTQIDLLCKVKPVNVIKVGDLVRDKAKTDPEIARVLQQGGLVDNSLVDKEVANKISSFAEGSTIISDGFPRDLPQAEWLDKFISDKDVEIEKFLYLDIPDEESIKRLLKRGRDDDDLEVIKKRIEVFHDRTKDVLKYYRQKDIYASVDGVGSIEQIHQRIKEVLGW